MWIQSPEKKAALLMYLSMWLAINPAMNWTPKASLSWERNPYITAQPQHAILHLHCTCILFIVYHCVLCLHTKGAPLRGTFGNDLLLRDILATQHKDLMCLQPTQGCPPSLLSPPVCPKFFVLCLCQLNSENWVQVTLRFWHNISKAVTKQDRAMSWYFSTFHLA